MIALHASASLNPLGGVWRQSQSTAHDTARVRPEVTEAVDDWYSINPPAGVREAYQAQRDYFIAQSYPASSSTASYWRFWEEHCARWGCRTPWRDNHEAISGRNPAAFRDEVDLVGSFVVNSYFTMEPRTIGTIPKVSSAFQRYLGVRREFDTKSIPHLNIQEIGKIVKGLGNALIEELGEEILLPDRKQPISNDLHARLLGWIPEGSLLGRFEYYANSRF